MTSWSGAATVTLNDGTVLTASRVLEVAESQPVKPYMGVDWSTANNPEPNYHEGQLPAARAYSISQAKTAVTANLATIKRICVTDDSAYPVSMAPSVIATGLRNAAIDFYEGTGSTARQGIGYHFAWRNEIFNEYSSGTLPANIPLTFKALRAVADERKADGSLRFPLLKIVCNATTWTIMQGTAQAFWKPIAKYLHGFTWSAYPPGRVKSPPVFTPYADFIDPVIALIKAWNADPEVNIEFASIWEVGIPVDKANQDTGVPVGTPDWSKRPAYMVGLVLYAQAELKAEVGIPLDTACYWNRQKAVVPGEDHPPNQLRHDHGKTVPDTADAWFALAA